MIPQIAMMLQRNTLLGLERNPNTTPHVQRAGPRSRAQWPGVDGPVLGPVSVEPGRVELRLVPDAGVHLQHLPDGHGGVS